MKNFILFIVLLIPTGVLAQHTPVYNQYHFNSYLINPAAAGANFNGLSIALLDRHQWVGFPGAPQTNTLSITKSFDNGPAIGAFVANDSYGLLRDIYYRGSFAYHSQIDRKNNRHIGFGIAYEGTQYTFDKQQSSELVQADRGIRNAVSNSFDSDVSMGFIFYGDKGYFGVSATNILKRKITTDVTPTFVYIIIDRKVQVSRWVWLDGTYLLKSTSELDIAMDFTMKAIFRDRFWGGLSYRTPGNMLALFGINYGKYAMGYGFEYSLGKLMGNTFGTHELMLSYNIPNDNKNRKNSPPCPAYY